MPQWNVDFLAGVHNRMDGPANTAAGSASFATTGVVMDMSLPGVLGWPSEEKLGVGSLGENLMGVVTSRSGVRLAIFLPGVMMPPLGLLGVTEQMRWCRRAGVAGNLFGDGCCSTLCSLCLAGLLG